MTKIYTKNQCQPCRLSKDYMTRNGVAFEEVNVETNPEAYDEVLALGYRQVPVIVAPDGSHWSGMQPAKLATLV